MLSDRKPGNRGEKTDDLHYVDSRTTKGGHTGIVVQARVHAVRADGIYAKFLEEWQVAVTGGTVCQIVDG
jgi:hypothetical protein